MVNELKEEVLSIDDIRLRNPKNDDLGDVIANFTDEDLLEQFFIYDGKEFLV